MQLETVAQHKSPLGHLRKDHFIEFYAGFGCDCFVPINVLVIILIDPVTEIGDLGFSTATLLVLSTNW